MPQYDIDEKQLIACYENGAGIATCAKKFGVTYYWARKVLLAAGVEMRNPPFTPARPVEPTPARFVRAVARFESKTSSLGLSHSTRTRQRAAAQRFLCWLDAVASDADDLSDPDVLRLITSRYDTGSDANAKAAVSKLLAIFALTERPHHNAAVRGELFDKANPAMLPAHLQVSLSLRHDIVTGTYKPGDKLPTLVELTQTYAVCTRVIIQAIRTLTKCQLLRTGTDRRTYIRTPSALAGRIRHQPTPPF